MPEQKINEALGELRKEGEQIEDPEIRDKLNVLVENIEQNLDFNGLSAEHHDMLEDVKEAITHFEVEHPRITGILSEVLMTLSNSGI